MHLGCSEIEITPNLPINLGGYGGRKLPGNGVASNLFARGFVFEHEGLRTGLITADLIMLNRKQVETIKGEASRLTGISPDNIIVSCSHTHSGPSTFTMPGLGNPPDSVYIDWLLKALAGALSIASNNLEEVRVGWGSAAVDGVSANRRIPGQDVDKEVTVLGFEDDNNRLKAVLLNFPCHPTVLGADNLLVTSDYPGAAIAAVKKHFPGAVVGFINGACGDISTRFVRRGQTHAEAERLGTILGATVAAVAANLSFSDADLAAGNLTLTVRQKEVAEPAAIEAEFTHYQKRLEELKSKGAPAAELRIAQTGLEGAMIQKAFAGIRDKLETEAHISVWRIGSLGLATIPGELFSSLGRRIKEESPFPATIIAGYSNGHLGYIPNAEAYGQGGYETLSSPLAEGFGEQLAAAAAEGLHKLSKKD